MFRRKEGTSGEDNYVEIHGDDIEDTIGEFLIAEGRRNRMNGTAIFTGGIYLVD